MLELFQDDSTGPEPRQGDAADASVSNSAMLEGEVIPPARQHDPKGVTYSFRLASKAKAPVLKDEFDYSQIHETDRTLVQTHANSIREKLTKQVQDAYYLGDQLSIVKDKIGHGLFRKWAKEALNLEIRTAERLMLIRKRLGGYYQLLSHLPVTYLHALTAPSVPDEAIETCITLAKEGQIVRPADVKRIVEEHKSKKKRNVAQREVPNDALEFLKTRLDTDLELFIAMLTPRKIAGISAYLKDQQHQHLPRPSRKAARSLVPTTGHTAA